MQVGIIWQYVVIGIKQDTSGTGLFLLPENEVPRLSPVPGHQAYGPKQVAVFSWGPLSLLRKRKRYM